MKDRAALPARSARHQWVAGMARNRSVGKRRACGIGALARMSDVAADTEVRRRFPVIAEALLVCRIRPASQHGIHGLATSCSAPAAPIFRDEDDSAVQQAASWLRLLGAARLQSQSRHLRDGPTRGVATNPSDLAVALAALDATVVVRGPAGERTIPFCGFPSSTRRYAGGATNAVERGDLIIAIRSARQGRRDALALPEAARSPVLRVCARLGGGPLSPSMGDASRTARLALGGVAHKPWRLTAAEAALRGASLDDITALKLRRSLQSFTDARPARRQCLQGRACPSASPRSALVAAGARA